MWPLILATINKYSLLHAPCGIDTINLATFAFITFILIIFNSNKNLNLIYYKIRVCNQDKRIITTIKLAIIVFFEFILSKFFVTVIKN